MNAQLFTSEKAAIAYVNHNDRKREPVLVRTRKGIVACSRRTSYKLLAVRGNKKIDLE